MIQINLLPGGRRSKGRRTAPSLKAIVAGSAARIKEPFLIAALLSLVAGGSAVGWMYTSQRAAAKELDARVEAAQRDSARFSAVIVERRHAEAQRDSVRRTLAIIRGIDDDRYVWAHILDEVSRSLPAYTWLMSVSQLTAPVSPPGSVSAAAPPKTDKSAGKDAKDKNAEPEPAPATRFRIVGHTVDIQALTRFMKLLELSPFIQNVQLARSEVVNAEGKEVTEFTLDAEYQHPDPTAVRTVPVSLLVR